MQIPPVLGLVVLVAPFVWGFVQIRRAQKNQALVALEETRVQQSIQDMAKYSGLRTVLMACLWPLSVLIGVEFPAALIFMLTAIWLTWIVKRLARSEMLDSGLVLSLIQIHIAMMLVVFVSMVRFSYFGLSDQAVIVVVLVSMILVLNAIQRRRGGPALEHASKATGGFVMWLPMVFYLLLLFFYSVTLWNPMTTAKLKTYVETFPDGRWEDWSIAAKWLVDSGNPPDLSEIQSRLDAQLQALATDPYEAAPILAAGVVDSSFFAKLPTMAREKDFLVTGFSADRSFLGVYPSTFNEIIVMAGRGDFTPQEREILVNRLELTIKQRNRNGYGELEDQLAATKLAILLGASNWVETHRELVHKTLVEHQVTHAQMLMNSGGFARSIALGSAVEATAAAIELMELYGVPDGVDVDLLRSYLRPHAPDRFFGRTYQEGVRFASLERLESLPDVKPVGWMKRGWYDRNILASMLFAGLVLVTVLGSPSLQVLSKSHEEHSHGQSN